MEAMRALKRRLSDIVYRQMTHDAAAPMATGPGGHRGTSANSSVTDSHPHTGSSEKSLPEPADNNLRTSPQRRLDTEGSHVRTMAARARTDDVGPVAPDAPDRALAGAMGCAAYRRHARPRTARTVTSPEQGKRGSYSATRWSAANA